MPRQVMPLWTMKLTIGLDPGRMVIEFDAELWADRQTLIETTMGVEDERT